MAVQQLDYSTIYLQHNLHTAQFTYSTIYIQHNLPKGNVKKHNRSQLCDDIVFVNDGHSKMLDI